jgi:hypothetical protein
VSVGQVRRGARFASRRRSAGGGAPAFVTSARGNDEATGNNSTSVITVPGGVASNHVMLVVGVQNTGSDTQTIAGGGAGATWTRRQGPSDFSTANGRGYLWTSRATGSSAGATITVTSTGSHRFPALLMVCSGVTETGILTAVTVNGSSDITSHVFPSVTVVTGGSLLLGISAVKSASDIVATFTGGVPASTTLDDESNTAAPSTPNFTVSGFHQATTVAAGSRTIGTATSKSAADATTYAVKSILYTIALAPA